SKIQKALAWIRFDARQATIDLRLLLVGLQGSQDEDGRNAGAHLNHLCRREMSDHHVEYFCLDYAVALAIALSRHLIVSGEKTDLRNIPAERVREFDLLLHVPIDSRSRLLAVPTAHVSLDRCDIRKRAVVVRRRKRQAVILLKERVEFRSLRLCE